MNGLPGLLMSGVKSQVYPSARDRYLALDIRKTPWTPEEERVYKG